MITQRNTMKMISVFKKENVLGEMFRDAMSSYNNVCSTTTLKHLFSSFFCCFFFRHPIFPLILNYPDYFCHAISVIIPFFLRGPLSFLNGKIKHQFKGCGKKKYNNSVTPPLTVYNFLNLAVKWEEF